MISITVILISSRCKPSKTDPSRHVYTTISSAKPSFVKSISYDKLLSLSMTQIEMSNAKCSFIWKYKRSFTRKSQSNATNNETILKFPTEVKVKKKY